LTLSLEVQTYYPAFTSTSNCKVETTGIITSGSNIIKVGPVFYKSCNGRDKKVSSISEINIGHQIIGGCIPNGTIIRSIDIQKSEVTLSRELSCDLETTVTFLVSDPGSVVQPYRTRWFGNLQPLLVSRMPDNNINSNPNNNNFNSNQK
jgi:hypothetical protein